MATARRLPTFVWPRSNRRVRSEACHSLHMAAPSVGEPLQCLRSGKVAAKRCAAGAGLDRTPLLRLQWRSIFVDWVAVDWVRDRGS